MIILKAIILQIFWFLCVYYGSRDSWIPYALVGVIFVIINYLVYKPKISFARYMSLLTAFSTWGIVQDYLLVKFELFNVTDLQLWTLPLWIVFLCYYGDILNKLERINLLILSVVGGVGGAFAYWSGAGLSVIDITESKQLEYILFVFISWSIFFPLSLKEFKNAGIWNWLFDKTIIFSFDSSGYLRHHFQFKESFKSLNLSGKKALVTGGTSGIGESTAHVLASIGCECFITGRNPDRVEVKENISFMKLDMADKEAILEFGDTFDSRLDYVVLNAGGMPPEYTENKQGLEYQLASQLLGHYLLIERLRKNGALNSGCRIVWVSSGGMYLKKLNLDELFNNRNYDKVSTYANVKRSQVTLVEELALNGKWDQYPMFCMHPGWVRTSGLSGALPGFVKLMNHRLRTPSQGADTILWLLLTEKTLTRGGFYFDRKKVSAYINQSYVPTRSQRNLLLKEVYRYSV